VVSALWPKSLQAFASASTQTGGKYDVQGLLPPHHRRALACDRAVCLPQDGPYHTLLRPRIVSLFRCTVRNAGSARYGTSGHRSNSRRAAEAAAQVQRRFGAVFPALVAAFNLCNTGTLSLGPAAYVDPEFLQQHRQKRELLSRQFGVLGCSKVLFEAAVLSGLSPSPSHPQG
jgi:hypothetical protein